jgi:hypothetical protein
MNRVTRVSLRPQSELAVARVRWNHFIGATDEDCYGAGVGTFFYHEHAFAQGAEFEFSDKTCVTEFLRSQVLESGDNPTVRRDRD